MEKSYILNLALGGYLDKINFLGNEDYRKYTKELYDIAENMCEGLPEEEKRKIICDMSASQGALEALNADKYFVEGFKLGLKIAVESFLK